jgi:hypothetical protein
MIVMYDQTGKTIKTINLYEAFPSSIRSIPLGWNDNNNLIRLAISVTYSSYTIIGSNLNENSSQASTGGASSTTTTGVISV